MGLAVFRFGVWGVRFESCRCAEIVYHELTPKLFVAWISCPDLLARIVTLIVAVILLSR